jgi:uncharacterized membrane protein
MHYFPLAFPFVLALLFLLAVLIVLVELRVLSYAYEKLGLNQRYVFSLLLLSLLGSYVNIPVAELPEKEIVGGRVVTYFGVRYVVPVVQHRPATIIAVNVGGAVIPTLLSLFLLVKNRLFVLGPLAVVIMAAAVYPMAHPVKGVGIAMPVLIPPLLAAGIALILSRKNAASLAYAAGSLGTLIGADLLHLGSIQGLGAPIASIGGAGTFDGIFLTGILAVLLA